jgi:hypothetical protein
MARQLTKELAVKIRKKLKGKKVGKGGAHQEYDVFDGDVLVVTLSIRRGSERDKGHDHLPGELRCNTHMAKGLAQCPVSKEMWLLHLIANGDHVR